jgi:hypothetical protein
MLILDTVNRSLEVLLGSAVATNQLALLACYVDMSPTVFTPAADEATTNDTTAVTLVAPPAAGMERQIKQLNIYNADTAAVMVTVRYNDNGSLRVLVKTTLQPDSTLQYVDGDGWGTLDSTGATLTSASSGEPFPDNVPLLKNYPDGTRQLIVSVANVSTATTRTLTAQDANYTLAGTTVSLGGTGAASFAADGVLYGNGTAALGATAAGLTGQVLAGNTGSPPTWQAPAAVSTEAFERSWMNI